MFGGPGAEIFGTPQAPRPQTRSPVPQQAVAQQTAALTASPSAQQMGQIALGIGNGVGSWPGTNPMSHGGSPTPPPAYSSEAINAGIASWGYPPVDLNVETPGHAENTWNQHGQKFFQEGPMAQWNRQFGDRFMQPDANAEAWARYQAMGPQMNNALTEYSAFAGRRPNIAAEPGLGAYYDNAQKNVVNELNTQLGARGAYGSSVGLGQIGKSVADLRADQAKNEADYNLRRHAEQRNWNELGGTLARNADLSGQTNLEAMARLADNASTSRQTGLRNSAEAAGLAGTERLRGLEGGMSAAGLGQSAKEGRVGMNWGAIKDATGVMQSILGENFDKFMQGDLELTDAELAAMVGQLRDKANTASQSGTRNDNFIMSLLALL